MIGSSNSSYNKALALLELNLQKRPPAKSSLSVARKKIGWGIFRRILFAVSQIIEQAFGGQTLWRGLKVFAVDGSKLNLPRNLKNVKYKGTHKGCFYPQGLLTTLVRLKTGIPVHFELSRRVAETKTVPLHLSKVPRKSVVVYDRLYFCWKVLEEHKKRGIHGVFRLRTGGTLKEVVNFIESGKTDEIKNLTRNGITYRIRFISYFIKGKPYYLATTLLNRNLYPRDCFPGLYHSRWGVEETFKFIKQELQVERFHSKNPKTIKQEIAVSLILAALSQMLKIKTSRKRRPSNGVTNQLIVGILPYYCQKNNEVRNHQTSQIAEISLRFLHQSPPGRSFQRRSRKVISRWQKSIAWEWNKKKRQQRRLVPP